MLSGRAKLASLFALLVAGFYVADHGALRGYFQDDDLDNLTFTRIIDLSDFIRPLFVPNVFNNNFRPVGHLFYRIMGQTAGLNYAPYILFLWAVHFLNVWLLWSLLRRLELSVLGACAGALFYAFHMAAFDVFWKPMYVFDLLCGFFCLLSLSAYLGGRWIVAVLAMWLGFRSKEVAIMLPVVLTAYEFLLGQRRWKRLIPFFALSLVLGIQALLHDRSQPESAYSLHLNPATLWSCVEFYSSQVLLIPYAGVAVLALLLVRNPAVRFGVLTFCALLVPMLLLPGRLFSAYLYVPLIGLSIAVAALAEAPPLPVVAAFFLLWLPWNYVNLRWDRRAALADAQDRRTYVQRLAAFAVTNPNVTTFIAGPGPYNDYGTAGAVRMVHPKTTAIRFSTMHDPHVKETVKFSPIAVLNWDSSRHDLGIVVQDANTPESGYIAMGMYTPFGQLEDGWFERDGNYRWIEPVATATLGRPPGVTRFQLVVNVGPDLLKQTKRTHVTVNMDGTRIGDRTFTIPGIQTVQWDIPPAPPSNVKIEFRADPPFNQPGSKPLGIAIVSFGFL